MKAKIALVMAGTALGCVVLASCGGSDNGGSSTPPVTTTPPPATQQLDTSAVLAIVQTKTSETSSPFQVDNGAVLVVPPNDIVDPPMSVDGT
jgi:hypothetical protein